MRKKIWILNHYASDMFRDKAGRHYWFAKELKQKGYQPIIFCANTFHNKTDYIDVGKKQFCVKKEAGIPYVFVKTRVSIGNGWDRIKNMGYFFVNLFPVSRRIIKKYGKPDIILASSVHPLTLIAGILIARQLKIPCICEIRDLWPEAIFSFGKVKAKSILGKLLTCGEYWIYRNADQLIFTKEGDTDYLKEQGWTTPQGGKILLEKCHYINNGVNLADFDWKMQKEKIEDSDLISDNKFLIVYCGMIRPVNHVEMIIECAKKLKKQEDIQILIYGDGSEFERLSKKIKEEKLLNVKMKGFIERKYIPYILSKADATILNYAQDQYNWSRGNSSNKLFEYMAAGKPVISTVQMGYSIIKRYHCGLELRQCSAQTLAKAILEIKCMSRDSYTDMCKNARRGAEDFDFPRLTEKLIHVIQKTKGK